MDVVLNIFDDYILDDLYNSISKARPFRLFYTRFFDKTGLFTNISFIHRDTIYRQGKDLRDEQS
ncbi:hypothetical protein PORY_002465 [Pneumocystis oryctolagi]|uniref:Uncharacterized protein n=1 Tax=Pneumocystis oryctolagi TaxID=42067 RepID=A0ACB7C979_9ASCO|nr:hypothetical protein PORY_002465 [Pneumocystis oryctolagi]